MIRRPPRSTLSSSSAASDVYKRQGHRGDDGWSQCFGMCQCCWERKGGGLRLAGSHGGNQAGCECISWTPLSPADIPCPCRYFRGKGKYLLLADCIPATTG
eukprot:TRINITY_DN47128_c0_g1_i1.p2 TRINITY_DN47128_c0_g1~~TRINITY_DN47128_c0_g1_i1.p2  ORF type:complete len:101 (-),score=13.29 TRINITY_DN47128_c0_g1_i1:112-414(-)